MPRVAGQDRRPGLRPALRSAVVAAAITAAAMATGCSLDYSAATEEEAKDTIPDTVAINVVHKVHRNGQLQLQMQASRAETYNGKKVTVLQDVKFTELDDKGAAATEGSARRIVYHTDTEDAEITGGVHVHSATEKGDVTADSLSWKNDPRELTAPPEEVVTLHKDDGTTLSGRGFKGDFRRRELVFSGPVQGVYVSKDDE
ncbi:MAG TPA: LPS export ABC transporter periplasmic protein LptC [Spirochaetia bacterium]